jgi:nucleotide-binding universal stress UspA family protein
VSRPIVLGYDGSSGADAALERAVEEAAARGAPLVVVTVAPMPLDPEGTIAFGSPGDGFVPPLPVVPPAEVERIQDAARRRAEAAGVAADYVWDAGEPAHAIVREAQDRGADAVVVGKGHHSRIGRWLGTDVAAEVERAAGCSVIVVDG